MELLESDRARPRQARYQAALRPDMKCVLIIRHLQRGCYFDRPTLTVPRLCQNSSSEPLLC